MAEEFLTSRDIYEREAKKHTEETAGKSMDDMEKVNELPYITIRRYLFPHYIICVLLALN